MRVSAPRTFLARTSFIEIEWLSLVNAGSDAQIFSCDAAPQRQHPSEKSIHNLVLFRSDVFQLTKAISILAIGLATSGSHEETQFRFEKLLRCNFLRSRHLHFRGAQTDCAIAFYTEKLRSMAITVHHFRRNIRILSTKGQSEDTICRPPDPKASSRDRPLLRVSNKFNSQTRRRHVHRGCVPRNQK